jgi:hypothetical protein
VPSERFCRRYRQLRREGDGSSRHGLFNRLEVRVF